MEPCAWPWLMFKSTRVFATAPLLSVTAIVIVSPPSYRCPRRYTSVSSAAFSSATVPLKRSSCCSTSRSDGTPPTAVNWSAAELVSLLNRTVEPNDATETLTESVTASLAPSLSPTRMPPMRSTWDLDSSRPSAAAAAALLSRRCCRFPGISTTGASFTDTTVIGIEAESVMEPPSPYTPPSVTRSSSESGPVDALLAFASGWYCRLRSALFSAERVPRIVT